MLCDRCGSNQENLSQRHVRLMGILWISLSALRLIPGLFLVALVTMGLRWLPAGVPGFVPNLLLALVALLWVNLIAGAVLGWGLLSHQPWAGHAGLVVAALNLWDFPFGAALGIYTLWALLPAGGDPRGEIPRRSGEAAHA